MTSVSLSINFFYLRAVKQRNEVTQRFQAVIEDWWDEVLSLHKQWLREVLAKQPTDVDATYFLPHFHRFALRGVVNVLEVLDQHWGGEISWESWSRPE
jgi:hypothetical protein